MSLPADQRRLARAARGQLGRRAGAGSARRTRVARSSPTARRPRRWQPGRALPSERLRLRCHVPSGPLAPASGAELLVLRGHEGSCLGAPGSRPTGARIVSGSDDHTVRVWDAASGAELLVLRGHEGSVYAAGFSPDGARIVSGSYDNTVRVWDAASGAELLVLRGHEDRVRAAGFSPDGARIVSGSDDKTVRVTWIGRSKQELIETARARLPRELTEAEKRRFYLITD